MCIRKGSYALKSIKFRADKQTLSNIREGKHSTTWYKWITYWLRSRHFKGKYWTVPMWMRKRRGFLRRNVRYVSSSNANIYKHFQSMGSTVQRDIHEPWCKQALFKVREAQYNVIYMNHDLFWPRHVEKKRRGLLPSKVWYVSSS